MRRLERMNWASRHNNALANPEGGWIYVIGGEGAGEVKVGKTTREVKARVRDLQTGSSVQLKILAKYKVTSYLANYEMLIHAALGPWRKKGEWFACPPEIARTAWAQVMAGRPDRPTSPQAWEAAHLKLIGWGIDHEAKHPKPAPPPPAGVHIPPFGPPILITSRRSGSQQRKAPTTWPTDLSLRKKKRKAKQRP